MARVFGFLLAFVIISFGVWPYYNIYRLDTALGEADAQALAQFVDLPAIRLQYREEFGSTLKEAVPRPNADGEPLMAWVAESLTNLGDRALEQVVTLEFVRTLLRDAAARGTDKRPAYFMAGINRAFFQSWNRFEIQLGGDTQIEMTLEGIDWRITRIQQ
jgi:hypothetical protein